MRSPALRLLFQSGQLVCQDAGLGRVGVGLDDVTGELDGFGVAMPLDQRFDLVLEGMSFVDLGVGLERFDSSTDGLGLGGIRVAIEQKARAHERQFVSSDTESDAERHQEAAVKSYLMVTSLAPASPAAREGLGRMGIDLEAISP